MARKITRLAFDVKKYTILIISACIYFIIYSEKSNAGCTGYASSNIIIPNITFNRDIPINSKITSDIASTQERVMMCSGNPVTIGFKMSTGNFIGTINGRSVFSTNVDGIGYSAGMQISSPPGECPTSITWIDGTNNMDGNLRNQMVCVPWAFPTVTLTGQFYIALYKTSAVASSGTVNIDQSVQAIAFTDRGWEPVQTTLKANSFTVNSSTCTVSNVASVTLPEINASYSLPQINSTNGVRNFSINVNCPSKTNVAITFTDNNNKMQTGNLLTPDASSTATGVAIQLQYLNSVIAFGPDSGIRGNTNQILLNSNLTGTQSFPFSAYYIRTGPVTPGTLSSSATFSMSYL